MKPAGFILLALCLICCGKPKSPWSDYSFLTTKSKEQKILPTDKTKGYVFVFLLPDCPFSQFYSLAVNQVYSVYGSKGYLFYGIVPGSLYTMAEIDSFQHQNNFIPEILVDANLKWTKKLKVTVVPEVIFTNANGEVLYRGKIDDQAIQPGQKKFRPSKFYLLEAMKSYHERKPIFIKQTEPVGCYIE